MNESSTTRGQRSALVERLGLLGWMVCLAWVIAPPARGGQPADFEAVTILEGLTGPVRLAASPTGQTLYVLQEQDAAVIGVDLSDPSKRWTAVPKTPGLTAVAIGCIDSSTIAIVGHGSEEWSLCTHRLTAPGTAVDATPVQSVPLGKSTAKASLVRVGIGAARDSLAVAGLPAPMAPILRATVTGSRLGSASTRRCPRGFAARPVATIQSGYGEWGFLIPEAEGVFFSWYSPGGTERLMHLATGLTNVRDAVACRDSGLLWVLAGEPGSLEHPEGLWRLDARFAGGRQGAAAVAVLPLPNAQSLVCLPKQSIAVALGGDPARVVLVTPHDQSNKSNKSNKSTEPTEPTTGTESQEVKNR